MSNPDLIRLRHILDAARAISPAFRETHQEIAWRKMVGMRDRLIHGYFDVNLDVVWETVTEDLPGLIAALEKLMSPEDPHHQEHSPGTP